jgi:hypothetical protein
LNLRLCSACEAINANDAERCHSCNAEFRIEPEVVTFEMDAPPPGGEPVEAAAGRSLPAVWRMATHHARKRSLRPAAVLAVLPLLAAGAAYYFYAAFPAAQAPQVAPTQVTPTVEAARKSVPAPDPEAVPKEPARPQTADLKPAQAPAVSGKITAPRTAAAPARSAPPSEPKRTAAAVTHTRAAGAETSSRAAAADAAAKTAVTTLPAGAASAPAASAAILPVSERLTHTKADPTESAGTTAAPAAATQVRTVPAEARSDEPAGCPPAVVALALCKNR